MQNFHLLFIFFFFFFFPSASHHLSLFLSLRHCNVLQLLRKRPTQVLLWWLVVKV